MGAPKATTNVENAEAPPTLWVQEEAVLVREEAV
jgi:hypothetical protein